MELRIAALTIIVEQRDSVQALNTTLHAFSEYIIGRFGLPYRERGVNIICVVLERTHRKNRSAPRSLRQSDLFQHHYKIGG